MYRPVLTARDRAATVIAVVAIHLGLALALLNLSGAVDLPVRDELTQLIDISPEPPPPIVEVQPELEKPKNEEGAASAKNIESKATPVVVPKPRIELPSPQPITASPTPNQGADPTQGASDVVGPGTGAGGSGTGSGGSGSGSGGGGTGQGAGPALVSPSLTRRDYPDQVYRRWPRGGAVFVAVRVQLDGRATDCRIDRSSGDRAIDEWTCNLVQSRLRFRPATDDRGRPFVSWYGYIQRDTGRMN